MPGHAWRRWLALVACALLPAAAVAPAPDARLAALLPQPAEACLRAEITTGAVRVRNAVGFAVALRNPAVEHIVITQNISLDGTTAFPRHDPIVVNRTVQVTGPCDVSPAGVTLSLGDDAVARVTVVTGGELHFAGPALRIDGAVPVMRHPIWPDHNPLLLGLVELNGTGQAKLSDLTVVSDSPVNASAMMQRYPPSMRPTYLLNRRGSSVFFRSWVLTQSQYVDAVAQHALGHRKRVLLEAATAAAVAGGTGGQDVSGTKHTVGDGASRTLAGAAAAAVEVEKEDSGTSDLPARTRRLLSRHSRRRALLGSSADAVAAAADVASNDSNTQPWPAAFVASLPSSPGPTAAWSFKNVRLEMPNTLECFAETSRGMGSSHGRLTRGGFSAPGVATCDSGDRLKALLRDQSVTRIAVMNDIIFHEAPGGPESAAAAGINITRQIEIRGCRPDPLNPNLVDFGELTNYIRVLSGGALIWSGNAHLINARATTVTGTGPGDLIPALTARGTGTIDFTGVAIRSETRSVFSDFTNPFWDDYPGASFTPAPFDFIRLSPPPLRERSLLLVTYTYKRTPWLKATGQDVARAGGGVINYRNVPLIWESAGEHSAFDAAFALSAPGGARGGLDHKTTAIALGAGIGGGGLLALATLAWAVSQRRKRQAAEAEAEAAKKLASLAKSELGGGTNTDGAASGGRASDSAQGRDGGGPGGALVPARWGPAGSSGGTTGLTPLVDPIHRGTEARIEEARQLLNRRTSSSGPVTGGCDQIVLQELLGEGAFGKVYKGLWKGTVVAVKAMMLPTNAAEKRERMAIMETAISSSLSHPNIVHTYTYVVAPVHRGPSTSGPASSLQTDMGQTFPVEGSFSPGSFSLPGVPGGRPSSDGIHSWEVRLVLEYCDKGTMREMLADGCFRRPGGRADMAGVLATALDVARAMVFLHENQIVHADLKARNVLLKSTATDPRGWTAKVGDFGLSIRIDPGATHISDLFQGTITHMAPETLDLGRISRASDVYAFGILLFELYTGDSAFKGVPKAMLGYEIAKLHRRPRFPVACPPEYARLAERCWSADVASRPSFEAIVQELQRMQRRLAADGESLLPSSTTVHSASSNIYHPAGSPTAAPASAPLHGAARRNSGGSSPRHGVRTAPGLHLPSSDGDDEADGTKEWDTHAASPAGTSLPAPAAFKHGAGAASPDPLLRLGSKDSAATASAAAGVAATRQGSSRGPSGAPNPSNRYDSSSKPQLAQQQQQQQPLRTPLRRPWGDDSVQSVSEGVTVEPSISTLAWRGAPIIPFHRGTPMMMTPQPPASLEATPATSTATVPAPLHSSSAAASGAAAAAAAAAASRLPVRSAFADSSDESARVGGALAAAIGSRSGDQSPSHASAASSHMAAAAAAVAAAVAAVQGLPQTPLSPPLRFGAGGAPTGTGNSILADVAKTPTPPAAAATPRAIAAWRLQRIASGAADGSGAPIVPRPPSNDSPGSGNGGDEHNPPRSASAASLRALWESRAASAGSANSGRLGPPGSVSPESGGAAGPSRLPPTPGLLRARSLGTTPVSGPLPASNISPPRDGLRLPPPAVVLPRAQSAAHPGAQSPPQQVVRKT